MNLTLTRDTFTTKTTTGLLAVDGEVLFCTLEDVDRGLDSAQPETLKGKVKAQTAIPYGRYRVEKTWSPKYKRDVYQLLDVPGFKGIRIHSGNKAEDTEGCLLVGTKRSVDFVGNSRAAVKALEALLDAATDDIFIDIVRG